MTDFLQKADEEMRAEREKNIKKEIRTLKKVLPYIDKGKKSTVMTLIEEAGFLRAILKELKEEITAHGVREEYQNGENQRGYKKSVAAEIHDKYLNTYIKTVSAICKEVAVETGADQSPEKALQEFMMRGVKK